MDSGSVNVGMSPPRPFDIPMIPSPPIPSNIYTFSNAKILTVIPCINCSDRNNEPQSISGSNLAPAPCLREGQFGLSIDEHRIGTAECFCANVILLHPGESIIG